MTNFNLLPWRDQQRKHQQQAFMILLSSTTGICICVLFVMHIIINHMTSIQQTRNNYLIQQNQRIDRTIKEIHTLDQTRQALIERSQAIQKLQLARPSIVHIFDEIARTVPNHLHLVELQQQRENIKLTGMAESNASISTYMRNIENSFWLNTPTLRIISSQENVANRQQHFSMSLTQQSSQPTHTSVQ